MNVWKALLKNFLVKNKKKFLPEKKIFCNKSLNIAAFCALQ